MLEGRDYVILIVYSQEKLKKKKTKNWEVLFGSPEKRPIIRADFSEFFWTRNYRYHIVPAL